MAKAKAKQKVIGPIDYDVEGYCVKCKDKRFMEDPVEVEMKNGAHAAKGSCEECDTGMFKLLPKS